jgi:hypothetical protein
MKEGSELDRRLIVQLADSITDTHSLEQLVRPLLGLAGKATGLESTYMTAIDETAGLQHVLYARNSSSMHHPGRAGRALGRHPVQARAGRGSRVFG